MKVGEGRALEKGWLGRSRMHPTVLLCVLSHPCVCMCMGRWWWWWGVAYVRSCAHIHQWNVKRKRRGFSSLSLCFVVFCSLSTVL